MNSVEEKLKQIINKISDNYVNVDEISNQTNLFEDVGLDSLKIMELVVEIEIQFGIEIDEDDLNMDKISNYYNLKMLVCSLVKKKVE